MTLSSPVFRAVATCVVPEASRLDAAQWDEMDAIVAEVIAARPRAVQRQLALFLILLEWFHCFATAAGSPDSTPHDGRNSSINCSAPPCCSCGADSWPCGPSA